VTFERDLAPPPSGSGKALELGQPTPFQLPAVTEPTLFHGDYSYRFNVPSAQGRLEVAMRADDPSIDVDLYLRAGSDPVVEGTSVVADYRAQGDTGDETLVVTSPALRAGTYYAAFGVFTRNREARGTLTATFTPAGQATGGLLKEYDLDPELLAPPDRELQAKPGQASAIAISGKYPEITKRRKRNNKGNDLAIDSTGNSTRKALPALR